MIRCAVPTCPHFRPEDQLLPRYCRACIRRIVIERDGPDCHYCGGTVGSSGRMDHVVPESRGGKDWPENRVLACRHCDRFKRDLSYGDFKLLIQHFGEPRKWYSIRDVRHPAEALCKIKAAS